MHVCVCVCVCVCACANMSVLGGDGSWLFASTAVGMAMHLASYINYLTGFPRITFATLYLILVIDVLAV